MRFPVDTPRAFPILCPVCGSNDMKIRSAHNNRTKQNDYASIEFSCGDHDGGFRFEVSRYDDQPSAPLFGLWQTKGIANR